jgi:hypothetical protein
VYHWGPPPPSILIRFSAILASKLSQNVVLFLLLRSLENSSDSKSMRVTSPSTCQENFKVDLLSTIVYNVISSTYIIKEIEKLVSCVYGVLMHSGNVGRTLEKSVKHSATPRVLHASLVFSQHSPRALSRHKRLDSFSIS